MQYVEEQWHECMEKSLKVEWGNDELALEVLGYWSRGSNLKPEINGKFFLKLHRIIIMNAANNKCDMHPHLSF